MLFARVMLRSPASATDLMRDVCLATGHTPMHPMPSLERASAFAASILVVEENQAFCSLSTQYLNALGYDVCAKRRGPDALTCVSAGGWQAVVLGFDSSDATCLGILHQIRAVSDVPVVLIGADVVIGLEAGADACLPRGCSVRQLLACLQAVTRRMALTTGTWRQSTAPDVLVFADLRIVPGSRRAILAGRELELTPGQFDLLLSLAKADGQVKSRDDLYNEVVDREYRASDRAVDVQISCLRRKLGDDPKRPRFIRTVRSAGYMLVRPEL